MSYSWSGGKAWTGRAGKDETRCSKADCSELTLVAADPIRARLSQWLGNNGEIIVELPTEDGVLDEAGGGEPAEEDGAASSGSRAKAKAKPHRFTAVR